MSDNQDEKVGYGRPPLTSRFKKGLSGNPKGRPKKARNIATVLAEDLDSRISVREGGRDRRMSKGEALAKSIVARALKGDMRAIGLLLTILPDRFRHAGEGAQDAVLEGEELKLLEDFVLRRVRSMPTTEETDESQKLAMPEGGFDE